MTTANELTRDDCRNAGREWFSKQEYWNRPATAFVDWWEAVDSGDFRKIEAESFFMEGWLAARRNASRPPDAHTPPTPAAYDPARTSLTLDALLDRYIQLTDELAGINSYFKQRLDEVKAERDAAHARLAALTSERDALLATIEIVAHCFETENDPADACNKAIAILSKALTRADGGDVSAEGTT